VTLTHEGCVLEIRAERCPACGTWKPGGKLFDSQCWDLLPESMQRACFAKIGAGFEQAYGAAKDHIASTRRWRGGMSKTGAKKQRSQERMAVYARANYRPK